MKPLRYLLPILFLSSALHGGEEVAADIPAAPANADSPEKVGEIVIAVLSDGSFRIERSTIGAIGLPGEESPEGAKARLSVSVPTAREGADTESQKGEIVVNVLADGSIRAGEEIVSHAQLRTKLEAVAAQFENQPVRIRGAGGAKYQHIVEVIDICQKAGIWNISFATQRPAPAD